MSLRLEDIELISQLKYRYMRSVDMADAELLADCFAEDAQVRYYGGYYKIELDGRDKIVKFLNGAMHTQSVGVHTTHHPEIDVLSDTNAEGVWYWTDMAINLRDKIITKGSGLYRDTYEKIGGVWKIKLTTYTRLYEITETFTTPPNLTAHYLATVKHAEENPWSLYETPEAMNAAIAGAVQQTGVAEA